MSSRPFLGIFSPWSYFHTREETANTQVFAGSGRSAFGDAAASVVPRASANTRAMAAAQKPKRQTGIGLNMMHISFHGLRKGVCALLKATPRCDRNRDQRFGPPTAPGIPARPGPPGAPAPVEAWFALWLEPPPSPFFR